MIKIVPKIMILLELFASGDEISLAEITRRTGLTKSNVSHLLTALCESGVLVRVSYGCYRRGERLIHLCGGNNLWNELNLMAERCADTILGQLNELTVVGIRFHGRRLTIVKRKPVKNLQVEIGNERHYQADWYGTANGRILLAFASEEIIKDTVLHCGLPPRNIWREANSMPKLLRELEIIRKQRFVIMNVDHEVKAIGVPVHDASGEDVISLASAFPVFSCRRSDDEILNLLNSGAKTLEHEIAIRGISVSDLSLKEYLP